MPVWLRRLHDEMHITSVFVTHDQEEALEVADRVVIMNQDAIEQISSPEEVYDHPATPFVYHFLDNVNLFHGRIHEGRAQIGAIQIETPEHASVKDVPVVGYVRPHDVVALIGNPGLSWHNPLECHYREVLCSRIHTPQNDRILLTAGRTAFSTNSHKEIA